MYFLPQVEKRFLTVLAPVNLSLRCLPNSRYYLSACQSHIKGDNPEREELHTFIQPIVRSRKKETIQKKKKKKEKIKFNMRP